MTKQNLVRRIAEQTGSSQLQVHDVVEKTFDAIVASLVAEGRIELRGFGVFEVRRRAARSGRNPRTGEQIAIPEKLVVSFAPGKEAEDRVHQLTATQNASCDAA